MTPSPRHTALLACHPASACAALAAVEVALARQADGALALRYRLAGEARGLRLPPPRPPRAADGLWQHTCCELFVAVADEPAYREFNFSPCGQWAAYAFDAYRQRAAHPLTIPAPRSRLEVSEGAVELFVELDAAALPPAQALLRLGLSVVAEASDATLSYWALHHPSARPDFHHRDAFRLEIPASRQAEHRTS